MLHMPIPRTAPTTPSYGRPVVRLDDYRRQRARPALAPTVFVSSIDMATANQAEMLGGEAWCTMHLPASDLALAVDRDLGTSPDRLPGAPGEAMEDGR